MQKRKPKEVKEKVVKIQYTGRYKVNNEQPLLEFLLSHVKNQSRNNIKSMLKNRCVLVDGVITTQFDYLLIPKQMVEITKTPIEGKKRDSEEKLDIIYEDKEIIVINKPAGLLSIATDNEKTKTAYHMLVNHVRKENPKNQVFVVHRLDRDTSGVLMIAKDIKLRDKLQDDWNNLVSERQYYAIVEGKLKKKEDTIKSYLTETTTHLVYSSRGKTGKEAITHYQVIKENKNYSLLKVNIDSGRKNQIRVHLKELGHPVIGDNKYGSGDNPLRRLGLHASVLELTHPITHKKMRFEAKIPDSFKKMF